jgi:hypothetical protein
MYRPISKRTIKPTTSSLLLLYWLWSSQYLQHDTYFFPVEMHGGSNICLLADLLIFPLKLVQASLLPQRRYLYSATRRTTTKYFTFGTPTAKRTSIIHPFSISHNNNSFFSMVQDVRRSARLQSLRLSSTRQDGNDNPVTGDDDEDIILEEFAPPPKRVRPSRRVHWEPLPSIVEKALLKEEKGTGQCDGGLSDNQKQCTSKIDDDDDDDDDKERQTMIRLGGRKDKENVPTQKLRRTQARKEPIVEIADRTTSLLTPPSSTLVQDSKQELLVSLNGCLPRDREMTIRKQNPSVQYVIGYVSTYFPLCPFCWQCPLSMLLLVKRRISASYC